jgi:hypothetical protein
MAMLTPDKGKPLSARDWVNAILFTLLVAFCLLWAGGIFQPR